MALRDFLLDTGVKVIYRNAHFPIDVVSQDVGKITLAGIEQMETFVHSELFLKYWVTEYKIPLAAKHFNLNIDVLFITNTQGMNRSYLRKYMGSQPLRGVVQLICHLNHYSALVDGQNQSIVKCHALIRPLSGKEFPYLVPQTKTSDPHVVTLPPEHEERVDPPALCTQFAPALSCTLPWGKVVELEVELGVDMASPLLKMNSLLKEKSTHLGRLIVAKL